MRDHDRDNGDDASESATPGEPHQRRDGVPGEKTPGGKLVQFSSGLSKPFIERPVMTMLLTASLIVFGILTFKQLAVNDLPPVDYPVISVSANYPGANPETMANTIATPLEKQFTQIPGLTLSTSSSTQGSTNITLQFELDKSIIDASTDVQAAIQRASGQLPNDLPSPPRFEKSNPNDSPVMYIALTSDTLSDGELYKYATSQVQQRINILPGISQVQIFGVKSAIRIKVDPSALASRNITLDELSTAIRAGTSYSGAGQFDGKNTSLVLRPNGQIADAEGYRSLIIARGKDGAPIYLRDVTTVVDSVQDERLSRHFYARGFSPPASTIVLAVWRQAGANAVEVARSINSLVPQMRLELPGSINLIPTFDRSLSIVHSVSDVQATLFIAFVLVVLVIFIFLGRARDTLIPVVALPLSILLTFLVMWALNYSINNLTLMALTLAIGFLVDDAIVVLENVVRRVDHGESIYRATLNSAGEISFTILSMTLSLAAVFIPLAFMPGLLGRIFREFSVTIIVAILASGLVSLTLTPLMCARILGERKAGHKRAWMERHTSNFIQRVIAAYGRVLDKFLDRAWLTVPILVACILGLWFFFTHLPFTLLPPGDSGFIRGLFIAQEGTSPAQMRAFQAQVNQKIQDDPAVGQFFTLAGFASRGPLSQGLMFLFLKPRSERSPVDKIVLRLQKSIASIPGITTVLTPTPVLQISVGATSQSQGQYAYTISGIMPQDVYAMADELLKKLQEFKGFASVRSDYYHSTPNLRIDINRNRAATYGVSTSAIQSLMRNAYSQNYIYLIKQPDDQYQVILEVKDKERAHPGDLDDLYVRSSTSGNFSDSGSDGGTIATTT